MNYLRPFITFAFAMIISLSPAKAQNNFDVNRMNRDLNIMENILREMFKTQHLGSGSAYVIDTGSLLRPGNIRGTYLPDFGVIFLIPDLHTSFFAFGTGMDNDKSSFSFVYRDDKDKDTKVTENSVIDRIKEFLRDYGSTIGQLAPDDKVMMLYGANRDRHQHGVWVFAGDKKQANNKINTLSVVASKQDLDAYRSGRLSAADFDKKVSVSRVSKNDKHLDMEVLANIFETAFKDPEEKSFRVPGPVNHLLLDNFGALLFFDASYTSRENAFFLEASKPRLRSNADASKMQSRVEAIVKSITEEQDNDETDAERREELKNAYSAFVSQLKEYLVDYGRTLSSVKPDQMILLSVSLNPHYENIPERIDVQVKKSVLEAMDRGNTNRDDVLEQVVIREY